MLVEFLDASWALIMTRPKKPAAKISAVTSAVKLHRRFEGAFIMIIFLERNLPPCERGVLTFFAICHA